MAEPIKSYVVTLYGIEGQRQHFMPGNRRKGTGVREKKPFDTEEEALAFIAKQEGDGWPRGGVAYLCSLCGKWHTASPPRR